MKIIDETGNKYGDWTVLKRVDIRGKGAMFKCKCSCGNIYNKLGSALRTGKTTQCFKCSNKEKILKFEIGSKHADWTILEFAGKIKNTYSWICECSCGAVETVPGSSISLKRSTSCRKCAHNKVQHRLYKNSPVYFIRSGDYVKIGTSTNIKKRFNTIKSLTPTPVELLETFDNMNEKTWHNIFAHRHHRGEWYLFENNACH